MLGKTVCLAALALAPVAQAAYDSALVGTWTTKSKKVLTGSGFYDPINDKLIEPDLTGFSYSFTSDGYYEEAYYRAVANPNDPSCPEGIMQWQHGSYEISDNGTITMNPIKVDGRQLYSAPCKYDVSVYTRYNQTETMKSYTTEVDAFHNVRRLNLYSFDGSPMNPMYIAYDPPQMLPTTTLNAATSTSSGAAATSKSKKRSLVDTTLEYTPSTITRMGSDPEHLWWMGLYMTLIGGVTFMLTR